jgi:hypothetical protein
MARRDFDDRFTFKKQRPSIGCADVTIVAITAITAFVILILILIKPDFAGIFNNIPGINNSTPAPANVRTTLTPNTVPTVQAIAAPTNTPVVAAVATSAPAAPPTATPVPFKRVKTIESCNLRPEPRVGSQSKGVIPIGTTFKLLGEIRETREAKWQSVEQEDNPNNKGWMWEICFDMKNQF